VRLALAARGPGAHERARREAEARVRRTVAACVRWGARHGLVLEAVASGLRLSPRTVRAWRRRAGTAAAVRGRPAHVVTAEEQTMIEALMLTHGPGVSTRLVQHGCPTVPRRTIAQRLVRFRHACRAAVSSLHWTAAGRVWAADWAMAPQPLEGCYRAVVHVRDLASGFRLAVVPIRRATAAAVAAVLDAVCATTDPPLVLKIDNGGPWRSARLDAWAERGGVARLFSPPGWPPYNGSIEASIGAVATRAHETAAWAGHPAYWTTDDVARARVQANDVVAPDGTTPRMRWRARLPITACERRRFQLALTAARDELAATSATAYSRRVRDRLAIVRTLQDLGYVRISRSGEFGHSFPLKTRQR
jgi:hypothetical protein